MSKSKGNVVDPDEMVASYGADTVRLFCLFASPPERDLDWSDQGVEGAFRFLSRVWRLLADNLEALQSAAAFDGKQGLSGPLAELHRKTHQTIKKVTEDVRDRFHFNTAIAAIMELVNQIYQTLENPPADEKYWPVLRKAVEAVILTISPMVPHIAEELWQSLGHHRSITQEEWPVWLDEALQTDEILIVVQVNGKLRSRISVSSKASREDLESAALADGKIQDFLAGRPVKKVVVVPDRLINIVV